MAWYLDQVWRINQLKLLARVSGSGHGIIPQSGHVARYLMEPLTELGIEPKWAGPQLPAVVDLERDPMRVLIHPGGWLEKPTSEAICNHCPRVEATGLQRRHCGRELHRGHGTGQSDELGWRDCRLPPSQPALSQIKEAASWIGGDSGLTHLAGICGLRTVAIFWPD